MKKARIVLVFWRCLAPINKPPLVSPCVYSQNDILCLHVKVNLANSPQIHLSNGLGKTLRTLIDREATS